MKLGVLFSSGKDSNYAMYLMKKQGHEISCLITIKSKNPDSYMFHTPNINLAELQAESLGIPIFFMKTEGEKEHELKDLEDALKKAKQQFSIKGIITGALYSNYQRKRIEKICEKLDLKCFSPLWHKDQEEYMRELLKNGFKFILSSVAAEGLNETFVGRTITGRDVDYLAELNKQYRLNPAGEGGEFESLVIDSPMFKKEINIIKSKIIKESGHSAKFIIEKAELKQKN
ncbi:diphthine--ammonia ligase [Candidatus Woesearchaeota archaeon]|nr:diphthine--ammonia ligase [Candidatus Woesearchaeota archaeon]